MSEELRVTKALDPERIAFSQNGVIVSEYFQFGYFQNDYFQAGILSVSGNTDSVTADLNSERFTVRID